MCTVMKNSPTAQPVSSHPLTAAAAQTLGRENLLKQQSHRALRVSFRYLEPANTGSKHVKFKRLSE